MEHARPDVALFIDWENLKYSLRSRGRVPNLSALRSAVEPLGRVVIAKAYADWEDHPGDPDKLYQAGIEPQYVPTKPSRQPAGAAPDSPARIPNSVDIKLTADTIETCHNFSHIQIFVLVGGDRDYLHAANILRPYGKTIVVIATSWSTSARLAERVDRVIYYDQEVDPSLARAPAPAARGSTTTRPTRTWLTPRQLSRAIEAVVAIIHEYREQGRRPSVQQMKAELHRREDFLDETRLDHPRFRRLLEQGERLSKFRVITEGLTEWVVLPEDQLASGEGATAPDFEEQEGQAAAEEAEATEAEAEEAEEHEPGATPTERDGSTWVDKNRPALTDLVRLVDTLNRENSYITFNFLLKGIDRLRERRPAAEDGAEARGEPEDFEHLRRMGTGRARGLVGRAIQHQVLLPGMLPQINYSTGEIKEVRTLRLNPDHPLVIDILGEHAPPALEREAAPAPPTTEPVAAIEEPTPAESVTAPTAAEAPLEPPPVATEQPGEPATPPARRRRPSRRRQPEAAATPAEVEPVAAPAGKPGTAELHEARAGEPPGQVAVAELLPAAEPVPALPAAEVEAPAAPEASAPPPRRRRAPSATSRRSRARRATAENGAAGTGQPAEAEAQPSPSFDAAGGNGES